MKVLITGAAGFLGRHFRRALAEQHDVVGFDLHPPASAEPELAVDVRDWARWDDTHYDLVIHAAAVDPHRAAIDTTPLTMGAGNLALDAAMFNWAARTRPGRLVYFSSCAAYPTRFVTEPMREDDTALFSPRQPDMYGWVKLTGERLARHYAERGGAVTIVRPFSGYGSDQDTRFPFGAFLGRAQTRADPFEIWGHGSAVRDWVHVDDIVGAVMALVDAGVTGPTNIGTGRGTTFDELARMVTEQAGYTPRFAYRPGAPTGPLYRVADTARLLEHYWPTVTLEEGIRRALAA